MTAVALQPNGSGGPQFNHRHSQNSSNGQSSENHSRSQSYTASSAGQAHRQETPLYNAALPRMNLRSTVSNTPAQPAKEEDTSSTSDQDGGSSTMESSTGPGHDGPTPLRRLSLQAARPNSSPGAEYSSQDESEMDRRKRRMKPLLKRSKSDFGPRGDDRSSSAEEETQDWGSRHGFDDHYASEEYVSQLANVSYACFVYLRLYFIIALSP